MKNWSHDNFSRGTDATPLTILENASDGMECCTTEIHPTLGATSRGEISLAMKHLQRPYFASGTQPLTTFGRLDWHTWPLAAVVAFFAVALLLYILSRRDNCFAMAWFRKKPESDFRRAR